MKEHFWKPLRLVAGFVICFALVSSSFADEVYRLKIVNTDGGEIAVSQDGGENWQKLGSVIYPTDKISVHGYMAASWVPSGEVAASAVNAIHIKVGASREIFSLLPKEFLSPPKIYRSFLSPDSSIYTDIPGGTGIFGGGFAPYVGSKIFPAGPPRIGETYYIIVNRPVLPREIIFENKFGGKVIVTYLSGKSEVVAEVLHPIVGIGRFYGTNFAAPGRIRANHAGVIDVSTSRIGQIGGFQIIPSFHTEDMPYVKTSTQWLVVGPTSLEGKLLEGQPPLFKYFIQPNYRTDDLTAKDWQEKLLSRYLVEVKYEGSDKWEPMPVLEIDKYYLRRPLPKWANTALAKISEIRILLPLNNR